jgi:hypothetical protein
MNEPIAITHLKPGDEAWIDRTLVSDWQVITQRGRFGPDDHAHAKSTLETLLREASHV